MLQQEESILFLSILNFLCKELTNKDLSFEDVNSIEMAIESLQSVLQGFYSLDEINDIQRRPLLDIFMQVSNTVSVKDRERSESLKENGNTKMENDNFEEAAQDYSQAIELDRYNAILYCNRAGARIRLQQYVEAILDCRQALNLMPDYAKPYGRMGQAYTMLENHRRAAFCFNQACEIEPYTDTYPNHLRVAEERIADDSARDLLIHGETSSETLLESDHISDSDDSRDQPEGDSENSVSGDDISPVQQTDIADTEGASKQQKETSNDSETLNETPENQNPLDLSKPQRLENKEESDSSENDDSNGAVVSSGDTPSKRTSDEIDTRINFRFVEPEMEDKRRLAMSIVNYLRNLASDPDIFDEEIDSIDIAIECLESAYDLDELKEIQRRPLLDMFLQVYNSLSFRERQRVESLKEDANTKMADGQYEEAEQDYSQAIELDRYDAILYCKRAGVRIRLQQYSEAVSDCRQALNLSSDYTKTYQRMGMAYALMDRHRLANRCFRQALELEPDNETYRNNLRIVEQRIAVGSSSNGVGADGMSGPSQPHTVEECKSGPDPGETPHDGSESGTALLGSQTSESDDSKVSNDTEKVLKDETDQVSDNGMNTDNTDTEAAPKKQEETPQDSRMTNKTPENENPPELPVPQRLDTKEISDSIETAERESIESAVKIDDNTNEKTLERPMGKDILGENKQRDQSQGLESKDTGKKKQDQRSKEEMTIPIPKEVMALNK